MYGLVHVHTSPIKPNADFFLWLADQSEHTRIRLDRSPAKTFVFSLSYFLLLFIQHYNTTNWLFSASSHFFLFPFFCVISTPNWWQWRRRWRHNQLIFLSIQINLHWWTRTLLLIIDSWYSPVCLSLSLVRPTDVKRCFTLMTLNISFRTKFLLFPLLLRCHAWFPRSLSLSFVVRCWASTVD